MRAKEFLTEQELANIHDGLDIASLSLSNTYVIPQLKNNDFYELYRFGVAIAAVRGEQGHSDGVMNGCEPKFEAESDWGEHQIVTSFDPDVGNVIDKALAKVGKRGKKKVATSNSEEMNDTSNISPIKPLKGLGL